ncbi:MAG: PAS domain S-box protein [Candidatus Marinimicrobia bacterium]|nr:PAS domain S-box protein [Candidatus Neomarinimicrobiota bacterium]
MNNSFVKSPPVDKMRSFFWLFIVLWTTCLTVLSAWIYFNEKRDAIEMAVLEAKTSFDKDMMYRSWASSHGGVYIKSPDDDSQNPAPASTQEEKQDLVHIHPEKMARLVYDLAGESHEALNHITSLKPIHEGNKPDAWERQALLKLESGIPEVYEIETVSGNKRLRFMGKLITEESCLKCHGVQGYKIGDIRGGISITIPYAPYYRVFRSHAQFAFIALSATWLTGILVIGFMFRMLRKEIRMNATLFTDLEDEKQYFENLFQNSPEGIILVDGKSNIFRVNDGFCTLFGFTEEELIGKNIDRLIAGKKRQNEALRITEHFSNNKRKKTFESIRIHKNGHPVEVSILGTPILTDDGQRQVLGIYRDISRQKQIEREIKESSKKYKKLSDRLTETNSLKELLLDIITHDLRNPAGLVSGAVGLLKQEYPDDELLGMVDQGAESILKVIDNATALSKLSMDESISMEKINVVTLIQQSVRGYHQLIKEADMTIEVNLPPELIVDAHVIIEEVFKNYISNAVKYATAGKKIRINSKTETDCITIEVSDFGETIQPEFRKKIFTRSFQMTSAKGKGSGLGLSIVDKIASANNATVGIKPNSPNGNTFFISFPVSSS